MIPLVDKTKKGTLILGYYRNGTHFLQDVICDLNPGSAMHGEICHDNTIAELEQLTQLGGAYRVCILNNTVPKFFLRNRQDLLSEWHVIHLTRTNKVNHFISYWFWEQNTAQERFNNQGRFKHNNTDHSSYRAAVSKPPEYYSPSAVVAWLQEQLINYHIPCNTTLDYNELPEYQTDNLNWTPNRYESIELQDIVANHKEIETLLTP